MNDPVQKFVQIIVINFWKSVSPNCTAMGPWQIKDTGQKQNFLGLSLAFMNV